VTNPCNALVKASARSLRLAQGTLGNAGLNARSLRQLICALPDSSFKRRPGVLALVDPPSPTEVNALANDIR
jgi:hypothetical protein